MQLEYAPDVNQSQRRVTCKQQNSYSNANFVRCKIDRKSKFGTCQILGRRLVSWFSKKYNSIATSTAEAKYIAVGSCYA